MGLEKVSRLLKMADENKFAVAAIDVFDYQSVCCVVKAAERERMPVILMFYPDMRSYIPFTTMAGIALDCAAKASVPVGVHLDHGKSYDVTISGLAAGFPSVMYDGSMEDFEINIDITRKVTDAAHIFGVDVEAELGLVGQGSRREDFCDSDKYTTLDAAKEFVERTNVDSLAIAIGNSHGHYVCEPNLDIRRLDEINRAIDTPLVLHGGSGIPVQQMAESVRHGINKVNIGTEFFEKCKVSMAKSLAGEGFVLDCYQEAREEIIAFVRERIRRINPGQFSL